MPVQSSSGYSFVETLFCVALILTVTAFATTPVATVIDEYRAAAAARYLTSVIQRARMEAVARSANVALQVVQDPSSRFSFALYVDGNGDGVRTQDIRKAVDGAVT